VRPGEGVAFAEVAGIEPTGRGSPVPLVLKTRGATRPRSPPRAFSHARGSSTVRREVVHHSVGAVRVPEVTLWRKGIIVKKLLLMLVVLALGAAVAYKVRGDA